MAVDKFLFLFQHRPGPSLCRSGSVSLTSSVPPPNPSSPPSATDLPSPELVFTLLTVSFAWCGRGVANLVALSGTLSLVSDAWEAHTDKILPVRACRFRATLLAGTVSGARLFVRVHWSTGRKDLVIRVGYS